MKNSRRFFVCFIVFGLLASLVGASIVPMASPSGDFTDYSVVLQDYEDDAEGTRGEWWPEDAYGTNASDNYPVVASDNGNKALYITADNCRNLDLGFTEGVGDGSKVFQGIALYIKTDAAINMRLFANNWHTKRYLTADSGLEYTLIGADGTKTVMTEQSTTSLPAGYEGWVIYDNSEFVSAPGWSSPSIDSIYYCNFVGFVPLITRADSSAPLNCYVDNISVVTDMDGFMDALADSGSIQPPPVTPGDDRPIVNSEGPKTVLQDFSSCVPGVLQAEDGSLIGTGDQYNAVVGYYATEAIEIIENENGSKSLSCVTPASGSRSYIYIELEHIIPDDTQAIAIRITHPAVENPVNAESYKDTSGLYPGLRLAHINKGEPDTPDWDVHFAYEDYTDIPAFAYLMDNDKKVTKLDLQERSKTLSNIYRAACIAPYEFEGWVILPKEMFSYIMDGSWRWIDIKSVCLAYENAEPRYAPMIHEIAAVSNLEDFFNMYPSAEITEQPQDVIVRKGDEATFDFAATISGEASYQWQCSEDNGVTWIDIPNATGASYTIDSVTASDCRKQFRVTITVMKYEDTAVTVSNAAVLYVDTLPDKIIEMAASDISTVESGVFEQYKGLDAHIIVRIMDGGTCQYSWTFYGKDIVQPKAFDPTVDELDSFELGLGAEAFDAMYIDVRQEGEFPGKSVLSINAEYYFKEGNTIYLYAHDMDKGSFNLLTEGQPKYENKYATATLEAGGRYLLNNQKITGSMNTQDEEKPSDNDETGDENIPSADTGVSTSLVPAMLIALFSAGLLFKLSVRKGRHKTN